MMCSSEQNEALKRKIFQNIFIFENFEDIIAKKKSFIVERDILQKFCLFYSARSTIQDFFYVNP